MHDGFVGATEEQVDTAARRIHHMAGPARYRAEEVASAAAADHDDPDSLIADSDHPLAVGIRMEAEQRPPAWYGRIIVDDLAGAADGDAYPALDADTRNLLTDHLLPVVDAADAVAELQALHRDEQAMKYRLASEADAAGGDGARYRQSRYIPAEPLRTVPQDCPSRLALHTAAYDGGTDDTADALDTLDATVAAVDGARRTALDRLDADDSAFADRWYDRLTA